MCSIVSSHLSLSAAIICSFSSSLAVLRFIPIYLESTLSVLSKQILGLPCLALGNGNGCSL